MTLTGGSNDQRSVVDDHGNSPYSATPLVLGGSTSGVIETGLDIDFFRLELREPTEIEIQTRGDLDTVGSLLNASLHEISKDDDSGANRNFRIRHLLTSGVHYIRVESYRNTTGAYTLQTMRSEARVPSQISIGGSFSYSFSGNDVTIKIDRVYNTSFSVTTGTLYARLFLTTEDNLIGAQGYWLATASFAQQFIDDGRLPPNSFFSDVELSTTFDQQHPIGRFNVFLVISEYPDTQVVLDSRRFPDQSITELSIRGAYSYSVSQNDGHNSESTKSSIHHTQGVLAHSMRDCLLRPRSIQLVASGYWVATASFAQQFADIGRLPPYSYFEDVELTTTFELAPPGTYNIFLIISEYPETTTVRASVTFQDRLVINSLP